MQRLRSALGFLNLHLDDDCKTLFPLTLILNSLGELKSSEASLLKQRIAKKLLAEKSPQNSFNYWLKKSNKFFTEPYPNDLDDTFCAWSALFTFDKKLVDEKVLFDLSKLLLFNQKKVGGPYFTWLVKEEDRAKWSEIDLVVNINVARFLATQKIKVLRLENYLDRKIAKGDLTSAFYKGELASLYFLSYFYRGKLLTKLKEKIIFYLNQKITGGELLLLGIAILRFGFRDLVKKMDLQQIFILQDRAGGVNNFAFYKYHDKNSSNKYYSSNALSTAFFIEFINLWRQFKSQEQRREWQLALQKLFDKKISSLQNSQAKIILRKKALAIIFSKHSDLAIFLPQLLNLDLLSKVKVDQKLLMRLSLINLCAWTAYTIYDDLNDEDGNLVDLPIANLSLQLLFEEASKLPKANFYLLKLSGLLKIMEENFVFEKKYANFKKNEQKLSKKLTERAIFSMSYRKSIGQVFSVYFFLDFYDLPNQKQILEILRCLLLLKQINDDLHDSFSDLSKGQINSVNYYLLKLGVKNFKNKNAKFIFYQKIIPKVNQKMIYYLRKAKKLLKEQQLFKQDNYFKIILSYYEKLIEEGQRESKNLLQFYSGLSK